MYIITCITTKAKQGHCLVNASHTESLNSCYVQCIGVNFHPVHGSGSDHFWGMVCTKHLCLAWRNWSRECWGCYAWPILRGNWRHWISEPKVR